MSTTSAVDAAVQAFLLHSRPVVSPASCKKNFHHDRTAQLLSTLLILGLIVSYLPQHYRIIHHKSSEGFSPFFLLLGATSSAASLLTIITLQWGQIQCCRYLTAGQCYESVLGIAQVFFQWLCFNLIFVLYLIFYPTADRWVRSLPAPPPPRSSRPILSFMRSTTTSPRSRASSTSSDSSSGAFDPSSVLLPGQVSRHATLHLSPSYRHALTLFGLTLLHLISAAVVTVLLLVALPASPSTGSPPVFPPPEAREHPSERAVRLWATLLGISAVVLGCAQYLPQLLLTFHRRLVGSLSIPMMCLQVPGSFVFVYTLAVRPGVNWTGWGTYFVTGILQGSLLVLCLVWKVRQRKEGVDDWGVRVGEEPAAPVHERTGLLAGAP